MKNRQNFLRRDALQKVNRNPRMIMRDARRMRDASQASPQTSGNRITPGQALRQFGWIAPALTEMGNSARWAYSLNPDNDVVAAPGYPLESLATSPAALINAASIAVAGSSQKIAASAAWPAVPAAVTLDISAGATNTVFGAFIRLSNSTQVFKYGTYEVQIAIGATVVSYVYIQVASLPCEVVVLTINNNAGKATVIGDNNPQVIFPYSAAPGVGNLNAGAMNAGDVLYAEGLNMRDIGNIVNATEQGAILL